MRSSRFPFANIATVAICFFLFTSLALAQAKFRIVHTFGAPNDGIYPQGQLLQDKSGNVYGTTQKGGLGYGTVFELSPGSGRWNESILYSFPGSYTEQALPSSNLVMDSTGNIFGTTLGGGNNNAGTIFELSQENGNWSLNTIYDLSSSGSPGGLLISPKGVLYGTSTYGDYVYALAPPTTSEGSWRFKTVFAFNGASDGYVPMPQGGALVADKHGNLYGTTVFGGAYDTGEVFEVSPPSTAGGSWSETVLYSFGAYGSDGLNPNGAVVLDAAGNLYGTTNNGGANSQGTVWQLSPPEAIGDPWTETIVHNFEGSPSDGALPAAGLVMDKSGNLYGVSYKGGTTLGYGTVYKLSPAGNGAWTETILHYFQGDPDGYAPWGGLMINGYGQLYGTTTRGGNSIYNAGVAFEVTP